MTLVRRTAHGYPVAMLRRFVDVALLAALLTIVSLRPMIGEALSSARDPVTAALAELAAPTPLRTLAIDLVAFAASAVVLLRSLGRRQRPDRMLGLEWGAVLFAVAAVISCVAAGDKRPAINSALDWTAALAVAAALVRLLDRHWRVALTLGVLAATGLVNVAECVDDRLSAAETRANYLEHQEQIWAQQDIPIDSAQVELFKQRLVANEASGFFAHSNVAGGYLLLGMFICIGLAAANGPQRPVGFALGAVLAIAFLAGILLTRSTGALAAAGLGLVIVMARVVLGDAWVRRRRALFTAGWLTVAAATLAVCGVGLLRGHLPHPSLDFRWQYWTAAAEMFRDHGLTGVGAENFGHHYTAYKPITSPEEVKNPHNFLVQFATEFGALGLLAALLMLAVGSWHATRAVVAKPEDTGWPDAHALRPLLLAGMGCAVVIFSIRIALLDSRDTDYLFWMTGYGGIVWLAGFAAAIIALTRSSPTGRAWLGAGCSIGLLVFLVQDTINFALFVPASRMSFLALLAVVVALRSPATDDRNHANRRSAWALLGLTFAGLGVAVWQYPMVAGAQRSLHLARAVNALAPGALPADQPAHYAYVQATEADRYDAVPPAEHAKWLLRAAAAMTEHRAEFASAGLAAIDTAIARSPQSFNLRERQAQLYMLRGQSTGDADDFARAVKAMHAALRRYPEHPRSYVRLADCQMAQGGCTHIKEAIASFQQALDLDAARPKWERFRRFNERELQAIQARLDAANTQRAASCPPDD